MIRKVVESAIANAENNQGADVDELRVKTIMVDEGPSLKRFMARAKGRVTRIVKRTSHITVVVGEGKQSWVTKYIRPVSALAFPRTGTRSGSPANRNTPVTWPPTSRSARRCARSWQPPGSKIG